MRAWSSISPEVRLAHCQRPESLAFALLISSSPVKNRNKTLVLSHKLQKNVVNCNFCKTIVTFVELFHAI